MYFFGIRKYARIISRRTCFLSPKVQSFTQTSFQKSFVIILLYTFFDIQFVKNCILFEEIFRFLFDMLMMVQTKLTKLCNVVRRLILVSSPENIYYFQVQFSPISCHIISTINTILYIVICSCFQTYLFIFHMYPYVSYLRTKRNFAFRSLQF